MNKEHKCYCGHGYKEHNVGGMAELMPNAFACKKCDCRLFNHEALE